MPGMHLAWRAAAALGVSGVAAGAVLAAHQSHPFSFLRSCFAGPSAVTMCEPPTAAGTLGQATLISGKAIAADIEEEVRAAAAVLKRDHGVVPGLAVVLVGERTDSATYVRSKKRMAERVGFVNIDRHFPETASEEEVLACVQELNDDPRVHAILVQLPLPKHMSEHRVVSSIKVEKDVDGFSAHNIGNLALRGGVPPLAVPCTPAGCVELLQRSGVDVRGKEAVVLGRSNIVGMPVAHLLQSMDATVTVCHSRTRDIPAHVKRADIVVAAIGKAEFVQPEWIKPGAIVIDVGINSKADSSAKRGYRLVGDVDHRCVAVAGMMTPVPGGVGPMTIIMLMRNTLNLARHSVGLERVPLRRAPTNRP